MKRLMITVIVVVMSVSGQALAGSWAGVLGNYPSYGGGIYGGYGYGDYGYGLGGIISEIGRIQVANRVIGLAENQQRQQPHVVREYVPVSVSAPAPAGNQYFDDVRIKGEIQRLKDENQKLKMENEELKKAAALKEKREIQGVDPNFSEIVSELKSYETAYRVYLQKRFENKSPEAALKEALEELRKSNEAAYYKLLEKMYDCDNQ